MVTLYAIWTTLCYMNHLTSWCKFSPWRVAHKAIPSLHGRGDMSHTDGTRYIWFDCYSNLKFLMEPEKALILGDVLTDLCLLLDGDRSQIWKVTHNYPRILDFESPNNHQHYPGSLFTPKKFQDLVSVKLKICPPEVLDKMAVDRTLGKNATHHNANC